VRRSLLEAGVTEVLADLGTPCAGETVVAALSGGADSVALLDALVTLSEPVGFSVVAAHLDHGLRPGSAADAAFCGDLCRQLGVPLRTERRDVADRARREGGGLEEAARLERYAFLARVKDESGAAAIALAHTRDDQAETVLLRLLRGAGRLGLSAMRARSGDLIRPLLGLSRQDVLDHLRGRGLAWREDPTNADLKVPRNRVRHELLPYLERHFNPAVREALARSASVLGEEADVLTSIGADPARARGRREGDLFVMSRSALAAAPRAVARLGVRRALQETGGLRGVALDHVDRILALARRADASGRRLPLPGGREAVVHFDDLRVGPARPPAETDYAFALPVPGRVELPDGRALVASRARSGTAPGQAAAIVEAPEGELLVRTRRPGDRVRVRGREVSLKRFLMDRRVPAAERSSLPLVAAGHHILWVPGQPAEPVAGNAARRIRLQLEDNVETPA
jgi:tRNA(Ile)-lysidine synthase